MKLDFDQYEKKFESVTFMFDLLRHAIKELGTEAFRRYMRELRKPIEANFQNLIGFLAGLPKGSSIIPGQTKLHRRKLSDFPITRSRKWTENKGHALLGINASELVFRVALLEAFLQDIHHHVLLAKPQLLGQVKPKRAILLKDLFRAGSFERVKSEEIRRQVREANRLRTKERMKFFEQRLHLKWGDPTEATRVCELIDLRHQLVHADPDKSVTPRDIEDVRGFFLRIPRNCFDEACNLYPAQFKKK